jgi:hypothetical protein
MSLRGRLRPWHGLLLVTFLAGVGFSLARRGSPGGVALPDLLAAVLVGLFAVIVLQFTVGNVWGYAVEYANAGGSWTDAPFLAPFVVAALVLVAVLLVNPGATTGPVVAAALWSAFWGFVVAAAMVAIAVRFLSGYQEGRS